MQFELSVRNPDAAAIASALAPLDPGAKIALDAEGSRLEVISTASANQVMDALLGIGCTAQPMEKDAHISGGSTCCGSCD